jgi:hypothetical protein
VIATAASVALRLRVGTSTAVQEFPMRGRAVRTLAIVAAVGVLASVVACNRAKSHDYETGDGIPAVPENTAVNTAAAPGG